MTGVTSRLEGFEPERLRKVRKLVVEQHPGTATRPSTASASRLKELRERVEEADGDDDALVRLASALKPRDIRGLARAIGRWNELRAELVTIIEARPRRSLLPVLWSTWHGHPSVDAIKSLLHRFGEEYGWQEIVDPDYAAAVRDWVGADSSTVAIQRWMDEQGLSYSDLGDVRNFPVPADTPLHRGIRDAVMTHGSSSQLRQEGADTLLDWFGELDQHDRMAFGRNYLASIDPNRWEPPVLERLEDRYGLPKTGRQRFWREVGETPSQAFQRFFIERNIEKIFGRGTDRDQYWKRWAEYLVEVRAGKAGTTDFGVLDFGGFVVVEFFKVGNAAYFYTDRQWEQIDASNPRHPSDLKEKHYSAPGPGKDNRLIHQGSWEGKADRNVRGWLRSTG